MLYWIWFALLLFIGWIFAIRSLNDLESDSINDQFISHSSLIMAIVTSWEVLGGRVFSWLTIVIPSSGTDIHTLTVLALLSGCGILFVTHPFLIGILLMGEDGRVKLNVFRNT
jgi:hypothetical protein